MGWNEWTDRVVGSSSRDLFCVTGSGLHHFDENAWRQILVPDRVYAGGYAVAAVAPGVVLLAGDFGIATVDASGAFVDYTSQATALVEAIDRRNETSASRVLVDPAAGSEPIIVDTLSGAVWQLRGGHLSPLPALPISDLRPTGAISTRDPPRTIQQRGNKAWVRLQGAGAWFDGERWSFTTNEGASGELVLSPEELVDFRGGVACPSWSCPKELADDLTLTRLAVTPGTRSTQQVSVGALNTSGPNIRYTALQLKRTRASGLALLGCSEENRGKAANSNGTRIDRTMVLHVMDGDTPHSVPLPALDCDGGVAPGNQRDGATEVLDGTWVIRQHNAVALIAPP